MQGKWHDWNTGKWFDWNTGKWFNWNTGNDSTGTIDKAFDWSSEGQVRGQMRLRIGEIARSKLMPKRV